MEALILSPVRNPASSAGRSMTPCYWCQAKLPYHEAQQVGWVAVLTGDTHRYTCTSCNEALQSGQAIAL